MRLKLYAPSPCEYWANVYIKDGVALIGMRFNNPERPRLIHYRRKRSRLKPNIAAYRLHVTMKEKP